jgi:endonuclease YncB( thermonuclease family)
VRGFYVGVLVVGAVLGALLWLAGTRISDQADRFERAAKSLADEHAAFAAEASSVIAELEGVAASDAAGPRAEPGAVARSPTTPLAGPFTVVDGDTFDDAAGVRYRLAGVDTPGLRRPDAHCVAEIALGRLAQEFVSTQLERGDVRAAIVDENPATGRYRERFVAVVTVRGDDLAALLVDAGLGLRNGEARAAWCNGL